MQQKNDIFSKVISSKTAILAAMVGFLVIYAIIGIIMTFSTNSSEMFSSIAKIFAPLGIIGMATVLAVDAFYKMTNNETAVKILGFATLILVILDALLLTLIIWEVIPAYERTTVSNPYLNSGYYGYYGSSYTTTTPTIMFKLTMSLLSMTGFTFLGSIVLGSKNNHKLIKLSKYIATGFLAISSIISIIGNFVNFSEDPINSTRIIFLQVVSWITAICLGATVFYLSKTVSWEEGASKTSSSEPDVTTIKPIEPAPIKEPTTVEVVATETVDISPSTAEIAEPPITEQPSVEQSPTTQNPMDQIETAEPEPFGHIINPTEGKE